MKIWRRQEGFRDGGRSGDRGPLRIKDSFAKISIPRLSRRSARRRHPGLRRAAAHRRQRHDPARRVHLRNRPRSSSPTGRATRPRRSGVLARVFVRACPPARPCARPTAAARVAGRCGPRRQAAGDRRLLRRRGPRPHQAGRGLRLHRQARLSPAARDARGHQRGARPAAQGPGPTRSAARCVSSTSYSPGSGARARPGRSCCAPTRGSGTGRSPSACASTAACTRSASRRTRSSARGSR
jgi:hypothetical protein